MMRYFRNEQEVYAYEPAVGTPPSENYRPPLGDGPEVGTPPSADYDPRQQALIEKALANGWEELTHWPPPPSNDEITAHLAAQIQQRLDDFVRTRGYDDILAAISYATSTVDDFRTEGQVAIEARDTTWAAFHAILNQALAGEREMPESIADLEDELPTLTWPT